MPEYDPPGQRTDLESLVSQLRAIRETEERLIRELKSCIDSTNKLLERIEKAPGLGNASTSDNAPSAPE